MYAQALGLQREPFSIAPDPRTLFLSERHREALAHLLYGAQAAGGLVLLTGVVGAGKTTVCRAFLEQLPTTAPGCRVAYLFNPQLSRLELLHTVCEEFGIAADAGPADSSKRFIDPLNRFLLERHAAGEHCLLVIDEAQGLSAEVLEQLRLLTNLETAERKLLQVLLIGQPELREMVARPEMAQLAQRIVARYHLEGLDAADTARYVAHRLAVAGLSRESPFDAASLRMLHRLSGGIPRRINLLADRALLALFARRLTRVTPQLLREVAVEVEGRPPPAGHAGLPPLLAFGALGAFGALAAGGLAWALHAGSVAQGPAAPASAKTQAQPAATATTPASAPPAMAVPAADAPRAASAASSKSSAALPWPTGYPDPASALRALALHWGLDGAEDACAGPLRCWQGRLALPGLLALDRPGLITLDDNEGVAQHLLLRRVEGEHALLQGPAGEQRRPLLELLRRWRGDFQTLWQPPPGHRSDPAVLRAWLDTALTEAGVAAGATLRERVARFQRNAQLQPDGLAGPQTLMRLQARQPGAGPRLVAESP